MDLEVTKVIVLAIYKLASLTTGVILSYMGYRLFMASVWGDAGDAEGRFGDYKIIIRKAAPGTFFVLMGALVIAITVFKGINFESTKHHEGTIHEQADKPPFPN